MLRGQVGLPTMGQRDRDTVLRTRLGVLLTRVAKLGQLPFTGMALWFFAALGVVLLTAGLRVRAVTRS